MSRIPWKPLAAVVVLVVAGAWLAIYRPWVRTAAVVPTRPMQTLAATQGITAAAPARTSRFLNTAPEVRSIGLAACAKCHPDQYASYLRTAHSRALREVDPTAEPPDASFVHAASGRTYEVLRREGQLLHRESLPGPEGGDPIAAEHAIRYAIGSGNHARTYLAELDGFLIESPLTWYVSTNKWAMSPGYDQPSHSGFERVADVGCLFCHSGRIEPLRGSRYRMTIHEHSIGCERCHGPGELHAEKHAGGPGPGNSKAEDLTIVHPARLSREETESACGQCHLRGGAAPSVRGQRLLDFRPGLRMSDFQIDFVPERASSQMKVVGHMEQMRASACYLGSEMTCTSCHDPHGSPQPEERIAFYRDRCNACHSAGCKLDAATRLTKAADDNCITCHMPQKPTELDHVAFTHHRIGFHGESAADTADEQQLVTLKPLTDLAAFSAADRDRLFGLAYMEFAQLHGRPQDRPAYLRRAKRYLQAARDGGAVDAAVEMGLAEIAWNEQARGEATMAARRSLMLPDLQTGSHAAAWFVLADSSLSLGDPVQAQEALRHLIDTRRVPQNWVLLSQALSETGDSEGALAAMLLAEQASPFRADIHLHLAQLYQKLGQTSESERQRELAVYLRQHAAR